MTWIESLNKLRGYDGTQHRLIGVEHTLKREGNNHYAICECGWTNWEVNLGTDTDSHIEAQRLHFDHGAKADA